MEEFIIVETYHPKDKDFSGEILYVDLFNSNKQLIMFGEVNPDRINKRIEGFFDALEYLGYKYTFEVIKRNKNVQLG